MLRRSRNISQSQHEELIKNEAREYFAIHHSTKHPVVKKYHKSKLFLRWAIKLLVPDFFVGHPNLWDNIKILAKNKRFRPLRMALAAWLIFSLTIGSTGVYAFLNAPKAEATGNFVMRTGYYYGNGTTLTVSGFGFSPEVVIVKADTAAGALVWKSSVMPSTVTAYLGVATADNTESEITLNADGFAVSSALEVNTINVRYTYIALAGSDCTAAGVMCMGSYVGDGATSRTITTGFQPNMVLTKRTTAQVGSFRTSTMSNDHAGFFSAAANDTTGVYFQTLDATGSFTVGATNNAIGGVYYYLAFKNTNGKIAVGQFTGNGIDNRNITGLGFEPDAVVVKQNAAVASVLNITESWGDFSNTTTATAGGVNHIQELQNDGFQVGNSTSVNAAGIVSSYIAFGSALDPDPEDSFYMERGSYTGTGNSQQIETSFAPDLVIIKGNTPAYAVWSTSLDNNQTHYFANSAVAFTGGITTMGQTNFSVGTNATVNTNGITYEYVVFGNATSPHTGAGAADFAIGAYTGNGVNLRTIDHLGMSPNMVVVKRPITTATFALWGSTAMAANTSAYFSATANVTDGTGFRSLGSNSFSIGNAATINAVNVTYVWFAFKEGTYFDVGSYTGNNTVDREITNVGFAPDYLWTKRNTAVAAVHRSSSNTITANTSLHMLNAINDTNDIKSFLATGFKVGNSAEVNTTGGTYYTAAWDSSTSSNPPTTPINTTPANEATNQQLNTVLTSSAYTDIDGTPHINTQWQVDDDADFASPVWRRTAGTAETSTTINTTNGTFSNELSSNTELDHNATYYWRVRYSDSVWSQWSTTTSYTTSTIATPVNATPAHGSTITTLTPTLTAATFSDTQPNHTATSAQWQISTTNTFTTPVYDSDETAYSNTHAVPSATLSDRAVYYWRVRYKDSSGQWSQYSTPTKFLVYESTISVTPVFGNTVVDQGDTVNIDVQVKQDDGSVINNATVTTNIYNPSGTQIISNAAMSYISGSNGIYRYSYTVPTTSGSYFYEVTATANGIDANGAANFEVRTIATDITNISATTTALQASVATILAEIGTGNITAIKTKTDTIDWSTVSSILTNTGEIKSTTNTIDWNDVAAIKTETNTINWSDITGIKTKTDTIEWSAITGITTTVNDIQTQSEEQQIALETEQTAAADFRADIIARLASLEQKIDDVLGNLDTVDVALNEVSTVVEDIRTSNPSIFPVNDEQTPKEEKEKENTTKDISDSEEKSTTVAIGVTTNEKTTSEDIDKELEEVRERLEEQSTALNQTIELLNIANPTIQDLLAVNKENTETITDIQNKVSDLRSISTTTRRMLRQKTIEPIIETVMKFNSVEIQFLITNPDSKKQTIQFKSSLPAEAKPEHIIDSSGMKLDYDTTTDTYQVTEEITLEPKQSTVRKVEMEDIWVVPEEEIESIKKQTEQLLPTVANTEKETQAAALKNEIDSTLNEVISKQEESYSSPENHIVAYRENIEQIARVEDNLEQLKDLSVEGTSTESKSIIDRFSDTKTISTWGIMVAIIVGFMLIAVVIFALWRHQTMLAAIAMGIDPKHVKQHFTKLGKKV